MHHLLATEEKLIVYFLVHLEVQIFKYIFIGVII